MTPKGFGKRQITHIKGLFDHMVEVPHRLMIVNRKNESDHIRYSLLTHIPMKEFGRVPPEITVNIFIHGLIDKTGANRKFGPANAISLP